MPRESAYGLVIGELRRAKKEGRTVFELLDRLGLGEATIRKHLAAAQDRGDVSSEALEPNGGPGRPPNVYFLTSARPATEA